MSFMQPDAWLSAARFAPFLNEANGDYEQALEIYNWHAELTAACFECIHHFEVVTRNAMDQALGQGQAMRSSGAADCIVGFPTARRSAKTWRGACG